MVDRFDAILMIINNASYILTNVNATLHIYLINMNRMFQSCIKDYNQ